MGRPKGSLNKKTVFLNSLLDDFKIKIPDPKNPTKTIKFDWREDLAAAIATNNGAKVAFYVPLLPYLLSKMVPKELNTQTPEQSLKNAISTQDLLNKLTGSNNDQSRGIGDQKGTLEKGS